MKAWAAASKNRTSEPETTPFGMCMVVNMSYVEFIYAVKSPGSH